MSAAPCRTCGACCAALRVGFPADETTLGGGAVPYGLTEPWIPAHRRMRGTPDRCVALEGDVGRSTGCRIYEARPSPCRALEPSAPGAPNPWCDQARARHGLPPLELA